MARARRRNAVTRYSTTTLPRPAATSTLYRADDVHWRVEVCQRDIDSPNARRVAEKRDGKSLNFYLVLSLDPGRPRASDRGEKKGARSQFREDRNRVMRGGPAPRLEGTVFAFTRSPRRTSSAINRTFIVERRDAGWRSRCT